MKLPSFVLKIITAVMITISKKAIQIGEKTHHHDHDILPINFRTINTMVNNPVNPIPELDELELLINFYFFIPT